MHAETVSSPPSSARIPRPILAAVLAAAALAAGGPLALLAQEAPRPAPFQTPRADRAVASQLFHVTLVAASRESAGTGPSDLPAAVAKALDDIKDFLPYKGYRVVDSALVRGSGEAQARLRGSDGAPYEATILFRRDGDGRDASFLVDRFVLRRSRMEELARIIEGPQGNAAARVAPLPLDPGLTASFRIARGETVVVGSSRLDGGDEALIVLLTAVP